MRPTIIATALIALMAPAYADNNQCVDVSKPRGAIEGDGGKWIELTHEQFLFAEGVYVMNPQTPPGFPFGDRAALLQKSGDEGGLIFFIDGERACSPMPVPKEFIDLMMDLGNIKHEDKL
jgi:hypothetical protein